MRSLIDILDLSTDEIAELISTADDIIANHDKYMDICHGKKLATLFFEPSTRTRLSFESAMLELGGSVLGFLLAAVFCLTAYVICRRRNYGGSGQTYSSKEKWRIFWSAMPALGSPDNKEYSTKHTEEEGFCTGSSIWKLFLKTENFYKKDKRRS